LPKIGTKNAKKSMERMYLKLYESCGNYVELFLSFEASLGGKYIKIVGANRIFKIIIAQVNI